MNRAFKRAGNVGEGRAPRYPGDLVVGEDKGPLADMIRRHSSGQQVGGDLSIRLAGQDVTHMTPERMRAMRRRAPGSAAAGATGARAATRAADAGSSGPPSGQCCSTRPPSAPFGPLMCQPSSGPPVRRRTA